MYLARKWNEIMGPKDERLEAQENKTVKVSAYILLGGSLVSLYYGILLDQVSRTTEHPILTQLGESVVPVQWPLTFTILAAGFVAIAMQIRAGYFSPYTRIAGVDRIPWGYVAIMALVCGVVLGLLTSVMRVLAEIQIVGVDNVAWLGDFAIGVVFFGMGFVLGFLFTAVAIREAINRRRELECEMEE